MTKRYFFICIGIFLSNALYGLDGSQNVSASDLLAQVRQKYQEAIQVRDTHIAMLTNQLEDEIKKIEQLQAEDRTTFLLTMLNDKKTLQASQKAAWDSWKETQSRLKNCQETGISLVKDLSAYSDMLEREKAAIKVLTEETSRLGEELEKREQAWSEKYEKLGQQIDELQNEAKKGIIFPILGSFGAGAATAGMLIAINGGKK